MHTNYRQLQLQNELLFLCLFCFYITRKAYYFVCFLLYLKGPNGIDAILAASESGCSALLHSCIRQKKEKPISVSLSLLRPERVPCERGKDSCTQFTNWAIKLCGQSFNVIVVSISMYASERAGWDLLALGWYCIRGHIGEKTVQYKWCLRRLKWSHSLIGLIALCSHAQISWRL